MIYSYLDLLAVLGIGSAHPGGFTLTEQLLQRIQLTPQTQVLDAGCGTGKTAAYIAETYRCPVTAVDINPVMIQKAKKRMEREGVFVSCLQGNVEQLPFSQDSFDVVLSESVMAFTNITQTLFEASRILKRGGMLIGMEMTVERALHDHEQQEIQEVYGAKEYLTEQDWVNRLRAAGFTSIQIVQGSTIAAATYSPLEQPDWDFSSEMDSSIFEVWAQHEQLIAKYSQLLGHRAFVCKK